MTTKRAKAAVVAVGARVGAKAGVVASPAADAATLQWGARHGPGGEVASQVRHVRWDDDVPDDVRKELQARGLPDDFLTAEPTGETADWLAMAKEIADLTGAVHRAAVTMHKAGEMQSVTKEARRRLTIIAKALEAKAATDMRARIRLGALREQLEQIDALIGRQPKKRRPSSSAARVRRFYERKKRGVVHVVTAEVTQVLLRTMIAKGLLNEDEAQDRASVEEALDALLGQYAGVEGEGEP